MWMGPPALWRGDPPPQGNMAKRKGDSQLWRFHSALFGQCLAVHPVTRRLRLDAPKPCLYLLRHFQWLVLMQGSWKKQAWVGSIHALTTLVTQDGAVLVVCGAWLHLWKAAQGV